MLMGGPRAGIQLTGHLALYELAKAQLHVQNTIRPLPWLVWDVDVCDCSCAILTHLFFLLRIRKVWQKRKCGVKYGCLTISHSTVGSVGVAALTPLCAPFGAWCPLDFQFSFAQTGNKFAWLKIQYKMGLDTLKKVPCV